ncbi:MAG: hypothetical protein ACJ705_04680 [Nitrososphaeraceae archaeon]|jgi:hypothetical protein
MSSSSYNKHNNKSRENDKILQNIIERSRIDFDDFMKRESANGNDGGGLNGQDGGGGDGLEKGNSNF